jgi:elongation factor 2
VVYRETVTGRVENVEGKSPNRHNRFYFTLEPLPDEIVDLIKKGEVSMNQQALERRDALLKAGFDKDDAKAVKMIKGTNMLIDRTKGIQYLNETMELIIEGIGEALAGGPLADEPVQNLKMSLTDVKLHEDAIHRGPAQVIPAVRGAIKGGMLIAGDSLLEPVQKLQITVPMDQMGAATSQIQGRRGQVFDMQSEGDTISVVGKAPVAELFGFAGDIRSATEGRAMWNTEFAGFELVPNNMVKEVVVGIRKRKGLKEQMPTPNDYLAV